MRDVGSFFANVWAMYLLLAIVVGILAVFFFLVGKSVGRRSGNGTVVSQPLPYAQQLKAGVMYTRYACIQDGECVVLSIKTIRYDNEPSDFFAIRTESKPPEHFAMFDGVPVEIKPPDPNI